MATEIFVHGCTTCGMNLSLIQRVKKHQKASIHNTKYAGPEQLARHIEFLKQAGMTVDAYHSIVVEDEGKRITLLKEWKR